MIRSATLAVLFASALSLAAAPAAARGLSSLYACNVEGSANTKAAVVGGLVGALAGSQISKKRPLKSMPQLLLELFSEEIPARMQGNAARDLERMARDGLAKPGLRRLTLVVEGLPVAQPDVSEEVKGPRVGAPDQAMDGFLRKTGLAREALVERDGVFYGHIHKS
eukprot:gene14099-18655_t